MRSGGVSLNVTRSEQARRSHSDESALRRLHRESERGAIAVMVALVMVPLMGMLALTVDVGYAYGQRRLAQNVADSAALNATVVVGKRLMATSETWVTDADVVSAIGTVASRSSGGYTFGTRLTADYVYRETGGSLTKVGDVGAGVTCTSTGAPGCIPSTATGVRVFSQTTFNTFFAPVLNRTTLATGARATALNATVLGAGIAPYALWTGENGPDGDGDGTARSMGDGSTPPDYLCRDLSSNPVVLRVNGNTILAPVGSYRSTNSATFGAAFSYNCVGGTSDPVAPGTEFIIRATPNYEAPSVSTGNPNWQVGASNFKGFIRIDGGGGFVRLGDYVSDGGIAGGSEDAGMDIVGACYRTNCTLIMPMVSYGIADSSSGHPRLMITGFAAVKVHGASPDPEVNSQNPTTAPTSYQWKAMVVNAPITCCPLDYSYDVVPGTPSLLYTRLYQ